LFSLLPLRRWVPLVLFALPLLLTGCSGSGGNVSASGTVTLDGTPVANAILEFTPLESKEKIGAAVTRTNDKGEFRIAPDGKSRGMSPGNYGVRVSKWVDKKTKQPPDPEQLEQYKLAGMLVNVLPYRYSDPEQNPPITFDLKAGKNDGLKVEMKTK
jgi:hypothetical protein